MRFIGTLLVALMLMIIGGEAHITVAKVVSVAKEIKNRVSPEIHSLAQEIANGTK